MGERNRQDGRPRRGPDMFGVGGYAVAGLILAPVLAVVVIAAFPRENVWGHLIATTLPRYLGNSLALMAIVGAGAAVIGTGLAWITVMTAFPGRRVLAGLLFAPLAVPGYIGAYALVDFLEYAGPVQTGLRSIFGWSSARDYAFPEIRSLWGAAIVLTLGLYPYVYLLARAAFREQSAATLEVARALGAGPFATFWRVALPLARPAIAIGAAVAMMETLNDFGAVDYFAVQTLTTGIFSVWLEGSNAGGAAQIACVILALVLLALGLERRGRAGQRFHSVGRGQHPHAPATLTRGGQVAAIAACVLPILAGFVLPVGVMLDHAAANTRIWTAPALWQALVHTGLLALAAALIALAAALVMAYGARGPGMGGLRRLAPLTQIGYAAPGAVIAVGVLIPLAAFDHVVADAVLAVTGQDPGLLLTGTAAALLIAYLVRFFAVAHGGVESALGRIAPALDMAARTLGRSRGATLRAVHLPLMTGSLVTAGMLVFVDAAKELPATLILRPFNFETLATYTYLHASTEDLGGAAPAALVIVALGLVPVLILTRDGRPARRAVRHAARRTDRRTDGRTDHLGPAAP